MGKTAKDENFPVGSFLLPAKLRPHVAKFYNFARAIDDIADSPDLSSADKIHRLSEMEEALLGNRPSNSELATAHIIAKSLAETNITNQHCRDLITAFKQDAIKQRYDDWEDLRNYCRYSASPVGRYLLDLHGESQELYPYSDALCDALQVINHMQDCGDDYHDLGRVYIPEVWLKECGADTSDLVKPELTSGLRGAINYCLDKTKDLLKTADKLPKKLSNRRLALESAVILEIAKKLTAMLRLQDPLAERVELTKTGFIISGFIGIKEVFYSRFMNKGK